MLAPNVPAISHPANMSGHLPLKQYLLSALLQHPKIRLLNNLSGQVRASSYILQFNPSQTAGPIWTQSTSVWRRTVWNSCRNMRTNRYWVLSISRPPITQQCIKVGGWRGGVSRSLTRGEIKGSA